MCVCVCVYVYIYSIEVIWSRVWLFWPVSSSSLGVISYLLYLVMCIEKDPKPWSWSTSLFLNLRSRRALSKPQILQNLPSHLLPLNNITSSECTRKVSEISSTEWCNLHHSNLPILRVWRGRTWTRYYWRWLVNSHLCGSPHQGHALP